MNATSTGLYYTYIPGGSWKLTALFESADQAPKANTDGGTDTAIYEVGSSLTLTSPGRGLVGYWTFEETGTTYFDRSGNSENGTSTTDLHIATSKAGNYAATFNGTSDYIELDNFIPFSTNNASTISAWVKTPSLDATYRNIYSEGDVAAQEFHFRLSPTANKFTLFTRAVSEEINFSDSLLNDGQWHHIAGTVNKTTGYHALFLDGVLKSSAAVVPTIGATYSTIGSKNKTSEFWKGQIDDLRIYNRALSVAEVQTLYNATK